MRSPSCRRALVATLLVALAVLCMGATALAAPTATGPAAWSAYTPADGASVGALRPPIAVTATDTKGLLGSPYVSLKVDGTLQSAVWTRVNANTLSMAFTPRANLANGTHTVYANVRNNSGTYSTTTWSFTVSNAPKPSSPTPVPGSTVSTDSPVITVAVGGATTGLTSTVVVDGTSVPATFDSGAGVLSAPTSHLANDASHDVTVTVTNSSGQSDHLSWSFSVQVYASMPSGAQDCVTCHPGFPDAHPMSNCLACHGPGSPVGEGWNTPDYAQHSASYIASTPTSCIDCHSSGYSTVPAMHPFTPAATYHDSTSACSPCHVTSLTTEHYRYGLECLSCHGSVNPLVQTAIATGRTDCEACHPGASSHSALHNTTVPESCAGSGCHSGTALTDIHINSGTTLTCDTCHKSTDTNVVAAIAGGVKACDACHEATGHEAAHNVAPRTDTCETCHSGSSLTSVHINSDTTLTCDSCHKSTDPKVSGAISAGDKSCGTCHTNQGTDFHTGAPAKHALPLTPTCVGSGCHDASATHVIEGKTVDEIHANATTTTAGITRSSCQICHWPGNTPTTDCGTSGCHPERLLPHGYDAAAHVASQSCVLTCHSATQGITELKPLHDAATGTSVPCSSCHPTAVAAVAPWDKTCSACHPIAELHPAASASHVGTDVAYQDASFFGNGCSAQAGHTDMLYCHDLTSLAALHSKLPGNGCAVCHDSGKTPKKECLDCHKPGDENRYTVPGTPSASMYATSYPSSDTFITTGWTYTTTPAGQPRYAVVNAPYPPIDTAKYVTITSNAAGGVLFGYNRSTTIPDNARITDVRVYAKGKAAIGSQRKMQGVLKIGGQTYLMSLASSYLSTVWTAGAGTGFATSPTRIDYTRDGMYGEMVWMNPKTGEDCDAGPDQRHGSRQQPPGVRRQRDRLGGRQQREPVAGLPEGHLLHGGRQRDQPDGGDAHLSPGQREVPPRSFGRAGRSAVHRNQPCARLV